MSILRVVVCVRVTNSKAVLLFFFFLSFPAHAMRETCRTCTKCKFNHCLITAVVLLDSVYYLYSKPPESNRPFARSGHMVRNKLCWNASYTGALLKQRSLYQSSSTFLCFESSTVLLASQHNRYHVTGSCKGLLFYPSCNRYIPLSVNMYHGPS